MSRHRFLIAVLALVLVVGGCAFVQPPRDESPDDQDDRDSPPGVFSGDDGWVTILSN